MRKKRKNDRYLDLPPCGSRLQGIRGSIRPMLAEEYESQLMVLNSERSGWGGMQSREASGFGWKWRSRRQGKKESEGQLQEAAGRRPNTVRCSRIKGVKHQRRVAPGWWPCSYPQRHSRRCSKQQCSAGSHLPVRSTKGFDQKRFRLVLVLCKQSAPLEQSVWSDERGWVVIKVRSYCSKLLWRTTEEDWEVTASLSKMSAAKELELLQRCWCLMS